MPPSSHEILTDDYVAELLAKEAKDCSLKYSAMGLEAFKSDKRPANQPKPNTRFLSNIIRDTNNHNRALLAKENAESQARLRDLEAAERRNREDAARRDRRTKPGPSDTRKRMLGNIAAILADPSKKRKPNEGSSSISASKSDHKGHASGDSASREYKESRRREDRRRDRRSRSRSRSPDRDDRHRGYRESRDKDDDRRHHRRSGKHHRHASSSPKRDGDGDSDPLDDIIGPAPPSKSTVLRRGRGLNAAMSGIDSRFAPDYDPTTDITPDPEEAGTGDWDNAVEAFRDRQKWKQQGADRLRSAGFSEDQIRKWEKGDKKDESDVQWNKAGRVREWDRGKIDQVSDTPGISDSDYGRLKGK